MEIELLKRQLEIKRLKDELAGRGRWKIPGDTSSEVGHPKRPMPIDAVDPFSGWTLGLRINIFDEPEYKISGIKMPGDEFKNGFGIEASFFQSRNIPFFWGGNIAVGNSIKNESEGAKIMPLEAYINGGLVTGIDSRTNLFAFGGLGVSKLNMKTTRTHLVEIKDDGIGRCWQFGAGIQSGKVIVKLSHNRLFNEHKIIARIHSSPYSPPYGGGYYGGSPYDRWGGYAGLGNMTTETGTFKSEISITTLSVGMFF